MRTQYNDYRLLRCGAQSRSGFSLLEIVIVVVLLAILGTGALVGLKHQQESASYRKVIRDLNGIDLAKQTWQGLHPGVSWPGDEPSRWVAISNLLQHAGVGTLSSGEYYTYPGFTPEGFCYRIGGMTEPSSAMQGSTVVTRPL